MNGPQNFVRTAMETHRTAPTGQTGRPWSQSGTNNRLTVERHIVDSPHWRPVARPARRVRELEYRVPTVPSLGSDRRTELGYFNC